MNIRTIKQKSITITIEGGRSIVARRMCWSAHRAFLLELAKTLTGALMDKKMGEAYEAFTSEEVTGINRVLKAIEAVPSLVLLSDGLIQFLITEATDIKYDEFIALDGLVALETISCALECNVDEELKNSFAGILKILTRLKEPAPSQQTSA